MRTAPNRLLHGEYIRVPKAETAGKILAYRAGIMRRHPGLHLTQVAVVLGDGWLRLWEEDEGSGFRPGVRTVYLRDIDPAVLLASPGLAPMAVLARGDHE